MALTLICASPGTDLRSCVDLLKTDIASLYTDTRHEDVEALLCGGLNREQGLEELAESEPFVRARNTRPHEQWNMEVVTGELSRQLVVLLWGEALGFSLRRLGDQDGIRLLSCHLTLYSYRSNEFYSPVVLSAFPEGMTPSSVLVLMDDVYDMFERLRQPGQVYALHEEFYIQRVREGESVHVPWAATESEEDAEREPEFFARAENHLRFEARINALLHLLAWRRADMITGELIAAQWKDTRVAFVGIKQDRNILARWVREKGTPVGYISHPISRPRAQLRRQGAEASRTGGWDHLPIVQQCNELQYDLGARDVFALMPTAIDELRIRRTSDIPFGRENYLDYRWPIPATGVLYTPPSDAAPTYPSLLDTGPLLDRHATSGLMRALEMGIRDEIAFRDHLLVAHARHLIVVRPLFEAGQFSGGVSAEVSHWETLAANDPTRRATFIHFEEDLRSMRWFFGEDADERTKVKAMVESLRRTDLRKRNLTDHQIDQITFPDHPTDLSRGEGRAAGEWAEWNRVATERAHSNVLWKQLTRVSDDASLKDQVAIYVVEQITNDLLTSIATFLKSGQLSFPSWEEAATRVMGDSWLQ